ncbi:MAG: NHLP bacteriocin export ABC transporter permease/ATPase subunit [Anaerolineae bacterium]|nr:NHLP bacteriocin export ABC transporter permease/ATPase subunit [Anaerolineae bacterium]
MATYEVIADRLKQKENLELFLLKLRFQEGGLIDIQGNQTFLLDDPGSAWVVYAGSVHVFAVRTHDGETVSARSHIFRGEVGQILLGMDFEASGKGISLLVAGTPHTRVLKCERARLQTLAADLEHRECVAAMLEAWAAGLANGIAKEIVPKNHVLLKADQETIPEPDQVAVPKQDILWVRPLAGNAEFIGQPQLCWANGEHFLPVLCDTWLRPVDQARLQAIDTETYIQQDPAWIGLDDFQRLALDAIALNQERSVSTEHQRLRAKAESDTQLMEDALERLASPLYAGKIAELAEITVDGRSPLLNVCRLIGNRLGLDIRSYPGIEKDTQRSALLNIARYSRFRLRQVALRGDWWRTDSGPLLGFLAAPRRPVALLPTPARGYELVDPVEQTRQPVTAEEETRLSSFAYAFYRPFPDRTPTAWELVKFGLRDCKGALLTAALMGTVVGLLELVPPVATDQIFGTIIPNAERGLLLQIGLALLLIAVVAGLFRIVRGLAMLQVQSRMDASIQAAIWDRILSLPPPFFRTYSSGDLGVRAMGITEIRRLMSGHIMTTILDSLSSLLNVIILFVYSAQLALVALALVLVAVLAMVLTGYYQMHHQRELSRIQRQISGKVLQFLTGIAKLRVAGAERQALAIWAERFASQRELAYKARAISNRLLAFNAGYPVLASFVIFAVVASSAMSDLDTGAFLAFNLAFTQFLTSMLALGAVSVSILGIIPSFEQIRPILEAAPEVDEHKANPGELTGEIEVSHASFRYVEGGPFVLEDVSVQIRPGEFVALVGPSGSGKSTLLRLLLGFEMPESGGVFYDGKDLFGLDLRAVRQQIGVVLQNAKIMSGDIYTNIVSSSPQLTLDDAWEAAQMAGLDEDIREMPMGMQTIISEGGGNLSGGQRQRLLIARALANKPRILFFDEATSALDNRTQDIVSRSLESLHITRVVIAHRLSTIINADWILVFDRGQIVQAGTYQKLINKPGPFAELAKRQLV